MTSTLPIKFLQQKVQELQSALFFSEPNALLNMPTHVVTEAKVDEEGQVWFFIPRPAQHLDAADSIFPAKLDFFRKGKGFFLKVSGKAHIVCDVDLIPSQINSADLNQKIVDRQVVAIRVMVEQTDYFESTVASMPSRVQGPKVQQFFSWLFSLQSQSRAPQLAAVTVPVERSSSITEQQTFKYR